MAKTIHTACQWLTGLFRLEKKEAFQIFYCAVIAETSPMACNSDVIYSGKDR